MIDGGGGRPRRVDVELPLPPPKNALRGYSRHRGFPSAAYLAWIPVASVSLRDALERTREPGERRWWPAHPATWWRVHLAVYLPANGGDVQNYEEAVFDLLSGAQVVDRRIVKPGGVWIDDDRVVAASVELCAFAVPEENAGVVVTVEPDNAPPGGARKRVTTRADTGVRSTRPAVRWPERTKGRSR